MGLESGLANSSQNFSWLEGNIQCKQLSVADDHLTASKKGDYYCCNLHYILDRDEWEREDRKPFQFCFLAKSPGGVVMSNVVEIQVEINFEPKIFTGKLKSVFYVILYLDINYEEKLTSKYFMLRTC